MESEPNDTNTGFVFVGLLFRMLRCIEGTVIFLYYMKQLLPCCRTKP